MNVFFKQCFREILIQVRQIKFLISSFLFLLILLFMFPLSLKPEPFLLRTVAPGVVWIAVLLSALLAAEHMFQQDYESGVLEQWLVSGESLPLLVTAKVISYWFIYLGPLLLLSPLASLLFNLSLGEIWVLACTLVTGTPALFFLCGLVAAFGAGVEQRSALMALVLLPLTLPLLIFGSGTVQLAMQQMPVQGNLALLAAFSVLAVGFMPYAIAGVLRICLVD